MNLGVIIPGKGVIFILYWSASIKTENKKSLLFPLLSLVVSVFFHGFFFILFSSKSIKTSEPLPRETERYFSIFNFNLIEPPQPLPVAVSNDVVFEKHAQNYIEVEELAEETKKSVVQADTARVTEYVRQNYNYIQRLIRDKLVYPPQARRVGTQGVTEVGFTIHEDGSVSNIIVRKSSGYEILDEAACAAVFVAAPFPKPPAPARIAISVSFRLR